MRAAAQAALLLLALLAVLRTGVAARPGPLGEAAGAEVAGIIAAGDAEHMRALLASASSIMFDSAFGDSDDGFYTTSWGRLEKSTLGHVQEPSIFQQKRTLLGAREG